MLLPVEATNLYSERAASRSTQSLLSSSMTCPASDVTARPGSRRPTQAEPCEAKLYEAPAGLPGAHGSGFRFLKPQAAA